MCDAPTRNNFQQPRNIWFPDFEEVLASRERRWGRNAAAFENLTALLHYFRGEQSRKQFLQQFFSQEPPGKMLKADRTLYCRVYTLCSDYRSGTLDDEALDTQLFLSFRDRPLEDVFVPALEQWEEILDLLSRLAQKMRTLPVHFDGLAWNAYLSGRMTRAAYTGACLTAATADHLAQLAAYGTEKETFAQQYAAEIALCTELKNLCLEYRQNLLSADFFDARFLKLAAAFCADIPTGTDARTLPERD